MFTSIVSSIIDESLDYFLSTVLKELYDKRRQTLIEFSENSIPAIDYVLQTCMGGQVSYPPESALQWRSHFKNLDIADTKEGKVYQKILLMYLKLDISRFLNRKESPSRSRTATKERYETLEQTLLKLLPLSVNYDFGNSIMNLATGLWAVDNEETNLIIRSLSNPSITLANYFDSPRDLVKIITEGLVISQQHRMALYMCKVHRNEDWFEENYDRFYSFLLVSSGQLIEALKYVRLFSGRDDYNEILHQFFELCTQWNATKSLNCLNLTLEEEEALNLHLISESRPVTPYSGTQTSQKPTHKSASKVKPRNRSIQMVQRAPSFNDSPARNTRSARKRKTVK